MTKKNKILSIDGSKDTIVPEYVSLRLFSLEIAISNILKLKVNQPSATAPPDVSLDISTLENDLTNIIEV